MGLIVNNDHLNNGKVIKLGELMITWDEEPEEETNAAEPAVRAKPADQKDQGK